MTVHPWNQELWATLVAPRGRSAHAWLFSGPAGLGKTQCAMSFARFLLGADDEPRGRKLFEAGSHPDMHVIAREIDVEGSESLRHAYARRHVEERPKGSKPKTVISIGQVRSLIESLNTRSHTGQHKVALLLDAHLLNINAANALLKLLEEPPRDTVLIAVSDRIDRLPATLRSRCSIVGFQVPERETARAWLAGRIRSDALDSALDLAGGAPIAALRLIGEERLEARREWLETLEAVFSGRLDTPSAAEHGKRLGLAEALLLSQKLLVDLVRCRMGSPAQRLYNTDQAGWLQERAERLQLAATFDLIDIIGRKRQDSDGPLDVNLLLEDLLSRMREAVTCGT